MDLVNFFQMNNFSFFRKKDALRLGSNIFETFRFAPRKNDKSVKELFVFQWLMFFFFVPVSQLSTRDLFYFLDNLKIKQDMFVLSISRLVRSLDQRALWFPYSKFWKKNVQENVNSWVFGMFYKVSCGVHLGFLTHLFQKDVLNCWLVKEIITFGSRALCKTI